MYHRCCVLQDAITRRVYASQLMTAAPTQCVTPCRADHHCYLVALDMARVCGEQCYQRVFGRLATRANDIAWEVLVFPSRISSMIRRPGR